MKAVTEKPIRGQENTVQAAKKKITVRNKAVRSQAPEITEINDRDRLRNAANLLLGHLEITIRQHQARTQKAMDARKEKIKALFGEKNTCMENLMELADLMIKIEKPAGQETHTQSITETLTINEKDMALVDGFVQRVRGEN